MAHELKRTGLERALLAVLALVICMMMSGCEGSKKVEVREPTQEVKPEVFTFEVIEYCVFAGSGEAYGIVRRGDKAKRVLLLDLKYKYAAGDTLVLDGKTIYERGIRETNSYGHVRMYTADIIGRYDPLTDKIK